MRASVDGRQGLLFPGTVAQVQHVTIGTWRLEVTMLHVGNETRAHAVLVGDAPAIEGVGNARRNPDDADIPQLGDEIAAARALHRLADHLLHAAAADIADAEGHPVTLHG